jgi:Type I phosphodiesterase / nucleotide pyrophosphatase
VASDRPPFASVDEVRDALKQLGYLDSGLDRFVLGGAGQHSLVRTCMAVAWRVGLVAGPLLGTTLAVAALTLDRRLPAEPTDVLVLAAYAALALGLVAGVAAFVAGLAVAWLGRRLGPGAGGALSRGVGLTLALGGLGYGALWWRSRGLGAPLALQALALVVALGLSLVLARFGSLAAVAVLSVVDGGRLPQARLSRRHVLSAVASAAVLCALGLAASYSASRTEVEPPDFAVVPTGVRVRVVGIDGLEWRMTQQMLALGRMPHLAGLLASGAHARLHVESERVPAIVWTTIATGRGPEAHGVRAVGARRLAGMKTAVGFDSAGGRLLSALGDAADLLRLTRPQPPTSVLRGVKTFWNVASEKGLRVGVVNWWATWPAAPVNGFVVTDRAFFKLDRGGEPDREVFPPDLFPRLKPLVGSGGEDSLPRRLDRFTLEAPGAIGGAPPDLEALYLPGLDIFTEKEMGAAAAADLAGLEDRLSAVRGYYQFVDECIGEAVAGRGAGDVVALVGDPGRLARGAGNPTEGLLVLDGGPLLAGDLGEATERDLAPTILHLVGLPTSRELGGRVLDSSLEPAFRAKHPVRVVPSFGRRPAARAAESAFDDQMIQELRSLGYIN